LIFLLAVLILSTAVIYPTPLNTYAPELEQVFSRQLHESVKIKYIHIALMPLPHLELQGVCDE